MRTISVGAKIKEMRIYRGLTQGELAKLVSCSKSMITQIERGTKIPTVLLANEIAEALNIELQELIK